MAGGSEMGRITIEDLADDVKVDCDGAQVTGGFGFAGVAPSAVFADLYDYPGEYAQRFDGVAPGGGGREG